jgi:hypothetical protein
VTPKIHPQWAGGVAQGVELLPIKCEALSSNTVLPKKKKIFKFMVWATYTEHISKSGTVRGGSGRRREENE